MEFSEQEVNNTNVPQGSTECENVTDCGWPDEKAFAMNNSGSSDGWQFMWSYRRIFCASDNLTLCPKNTCWGNMTSFKSVNFGDISLQNYLNDLDSGYLLLDYNKTKEQLNDWRGGLNMTALEMLEQRSFSWFHFLINSSFFLNNSWPQHFQMNLNQSGTLHGLTKFPYVRDTRRSAYGIDGFRLKYNNTFNYYNTSQPNFGFRFNDTIALGNYNDDQHLLSSENEPYCNYPPYLHNNYSATKPYYIPFRALTVQNVDNLIVSGKCMSQTFLANAATRVHPSEWSTGVAAGGTAALILLNKWQNLEQAYQHIQEIQTFLNSSIIGQPLDFV